MIQSFFVKCYHGLMLLLVGCRLHNFTVASGINFDPSAFNPETYTTCTYEPDKSGEGVTREMVCDRPVTGRYVTVYMYQTNGTREPLTICELEVFGEPAPGKSFYFVFCPIIQFIFFCCHFVHREGKINRLKSHLTT